ncbi:hypothetical protein MTO96_019876 [Rhipicephalus appendiculatus]
MCLARKFRRVKRFVFSPEVATPNAFFLSSSAGPTRCARWSAVDCRAASKAPALAPKPGAIMGGRAFGVRLWKTTFAWPRRLTAPLAVSSTLGRGSRTVTLAAGRRRSRGARHAPWTPIEVPPAAPACSLHAPPAGRRCGCATAERRGPGISDRRTRFCAFRKMNPGTAAAHTSTRKRAARSLRYAGGPRSPRREGPACVFAAYSPGQRHACVTEVIWLEKLAGGKY